MAAIPTGKSGIRVINYITAINQCKIGRAVNCKQAQTIAAGRGIDAGEVNSNYCTKLLYRYCIIISNWRLLRTTPVYKNRKARTTINRPGMGGG